MYESKCFPCAFDVLQVQLDAKAPHRACLMVFPSRDFVQVMNHTHKHHKDDVGRIIRTCDHINAHIDLDAVIA